MADNPATKYNPLFIYGGVGLGKTHLLHAIGHQIQAQHPSWRILYPETETFMNEFIYQERNNRIEGSAPSTAITDVLLMDDIRYLGGGGRTRTSFPYVQRPVRVAPADRRHRRQVPARIPDLEERIRSRLVGLIADIQPPGWRRGSPFWPRRQSTTDRPPRRGCVLAAHIKSNVREAEGCSSASRRSPRYQQRQITSSLCRRR